jgi:sulfur carrier protein ThiS
MNIEVWFNGLFHKLAERKIIVPLNQDAQFSDLKTSIIQEYGQPMLDMLNSTKSYFVLMNGQYFDSIKYPTKKLKNGDIVAFVTLVVGG